MIRVLIVDDSLVVQQHLRSILESAPDIQVIAAASDGRQAVELALRKKPDVITMDIIMPVMDGYAATRQIMETQPAPIVVVSQSFDPGEVRKTFMATEAGAVAMLEKPVGVSDPRYEEMAKELIDTVRLMSEVKVVRRRASLRRKRPLPDFLQDAAKRAAVEIVAMGASTGGPLALRAVLSRLGEDFPVPVLVVQHIAPGFTSGFVEWLDASSALAVSLARHQQRCDPGHAYVAPEGRQMTVNVHRQIVLTDGPKEHGHRPSVACLFRSVANAFGRSAVGVLLTGMGKDGAAEMMAMKDQGAVTVAQNSESCVVDGMPGEARRLGAVDHELVPDEIGAFISRIVSRTHAREDRSRTTGIHT